MEEAKARIKQAIIDASNMLDLSNLNLSICPKIPELIEILFLNNNQLTEIPELPASITDLSIDNNKIEKITGLSETLEFLSCAHNSIITLPEIPGSLEFFDCTYNSLISEPKVPTNCQLYFFPQKKDLMEIPLGSEDSILGEPINPGNAVVDFQDEASKFQRYYLKSSFNKLDPKLNPITRAPIKTHKVFLATMKKTQGGKRKTLKNKIKDLME